MVYVLSKDGNPLMPTARHGRVRRLIKNGKAVILNYRPFTIQLTYAVNNNKQEVSLGVDTGSKYIGLSATTPKRVLFEARVALRTDIKEKLAFRRNARKARRYVKTRYRKHRYLNRRTQCTKGTLTPSISHRIDCHIYWIKKVCKCLPINTIIIETAKFDSRLIKELANGNLPPEGDEYQHGELLGFYNVREYVLARDRYQCVLCHGKSNDQHLHVHHIKSRMIAGNTPANLITLCKTCHGKLHRNELSLPAIHTRKYIGTADATFMSILNARIYKILEAELGSHTNIRKTYGYITRYLRISNKLDKTHNIDARCISGNPNAIPLPNIYEIEKIRVNNRQIHKYSFIKGGKRKLNQAPYEVYGYRLFDTVRIGENTGFVRGRRSTGRFLVYAMTGEVISNSVSYKKLTLINHNQSYLYHPVTK